MQLVIGQHNGHWPEYVEDMAVWGYRSLEMNWPKETMNRPSFARIVVGANSKS